MKKFKTIGVLGGMGPIASAHFYNLLLNYCQVNYGSVQDDEYPQIIINSLALSGSTEQGMEENKLITNQLISGIKSLKNARADFIVIPCNSVHNSINFLKKKTRVPIISIIEKVSQAVVKSGLKKVLILSSETTTKYGLYSHLEDYGIKVIKPDVFFSENITKLILSVMGSKNINKAKVPVIRKINSLFKTEQIDSVILGCTELPLAIHQREIDVKIFDSLEILAAAAIKFAKE